jgi:uroporphyrinogen decarboxylase
MVDIEEVRRAMGVRVGLAGQIDPAAGVRFGSPDRIRAAIRETYRRIGAPYLPMAGCEVPAGTPLENLRALCEPVPA